ncbi:A24 family peptidase [Sandaracinobacteroides hominis]|uniref:A24 family peptidase n=1 Tax=Sandaracinobacteroides hominis TaxID=2780086 RepID=UPI0018F64CF0|nr:prepilin peptidase [Sandaracinobacteroides hominis]
MTLPLLLIVATGLLLLAACATDLHRFEIPDSISIAIIVLAVAFGFTQPGFAWGWHAAGFALMFAVGLGLFAAGWMGGGDIKLLVATAAWTGLFGLPAYLAGVTVAGGLLAIALLAGRAAFARAGAAPESMPGPLRPNAPLPYAIAIAGGAFWWAWRSWPLIA